MTTTTRWMIRRDMNEVLQIERGSFDEPWLEADFMAVLRNRSCIGLVAERGERVVGHMIYELDDHAMNILNLAVAPDARRIGVGRAMVAKLIGKLRPGRSRLNVTVRDSNLDAQLFYRALSFRAVQVLRGLFGEGNDGYVMRYTLPVVVMTHKEKQS